MLNALFQWVAHLFAAWDWWYVIGFIGQLIFGGRFALQWIVSEKKKESVIPIHFWYMSLTGSVILLVYGMHRDDPVFIFAYLFNSIVYVRNMMFIHKKKPLETNSLVIK
jgi:lipid-A-disaccharide synthase-like uncharacterized protein